MDIGNKIKQLRTRQGLTLEELASAVSVSSSLPFQAHIKRIFAS